MIKHVAVIALLLTTPAYAYDIAHPQISREDDAEILTFGRSQGRDIDLNLTHVPMFSAPLSRIDNRPGVGWVPKQIPWVGEYQPPHQRKWA